MEYKKLAYSTHKEMIFGNSLHPVKFNNGIVIGGGVVYPEVNFTLPIMEASLKNIDEIVLIYKQITSDILNRASILKIDGIVLEFEHLPVMTEIIELGVAITKSIKETMSEYAGSKNIPSILRVTPVDIRQVKMRNGDKMKILLDSFDENSKSGADMLAIESVGGKEVCDKAVVEADVSGLLLGLGILGCRDMRYLWKKIVDISNGNDCIPSGDTACGMANTAMVLADRNYIPKVLAVVIRAMCAPRTLTAVECGAVGPTKDCGYEGPIVKAITGTPISMEGKSSACAHFSHLGNIAASVCDLWSNESVQNIKLLAGYAPECFSEMLIYDCRLMNTALQTGQEKILQSLFVKSDLPLDPQAFIIGPEASFKIAGEIVKESSDFKRTYAAALASCKLLREGIQHKEINLPEREIMWLDRIEESLENLDTEEKVFSATQSYNDLYDSKEYGL